MAEAAAVVRDAVSRGRSTRRAGRAAPRRRGREDTVAFKIQRDKPDFGQEGEGVAFPSEGGGALPR